jgi:hypothetical protein
LISDSWIVRRSQFTTGRGIQRASRGAFCLSTAPMSILGMECSENYIHKYRHSFLKNP